MHGDPLKPPLTRNLFPTAQFLMERHDTVFAQRPLQGPIPGRIRPCEMNGRFAASFHQLREFNGLHFLRRIRRKAASISPAARNPLSMAP